MNEKKYNGLGIKKYNFNRQFGNKLSRAFNFGN